MPTLPLAAALLGCDPGTGALDGPAPGDPYRRLDPVAHAVRASLALRGVRPTEAELEAVRADPAAVEGLVDAWLATPEFAETVADMYAEWLQLRADVQDPLPALGLLRGRLLHETSSSLAEQPLNLVRHVVGHDLPLTELVTADYTIADEVAATAYGLPFDPAGPALQVTRWADQRPAAGLLAESELWRRHESAGSNFNRLRADLTADTFLCASFSTRDIVVEGGVTISDELEVAAAVRDQAECVSCHQALDPLAALYFGFKKQVRQSTVAKAYAQDCSPEPSDDDYHPYAPLEYCYPLEPYSAEDEDLWIYWSLRPPGYYGAPADHLGDLGEAVAEDPRFASCTARRFYGYLTQSEWADVPLPFAEHLQRTLVDGGFSARALAREIVLSDPFASVSAGADAPVPAAPVQLVRPEAYARSLEALTGFAWLVDPDAADCATNGLAGYGTSCWGEVDLMRTARFGFRAMAGGIDGYAVTRPTHQPTPPRELVWQRFAEEAAGYVVAHDLAEPDPSRRRLLRELDDGDVRGQIARLVPRLHGRFVADDDPRIAALAELWADKRARSGEDEAAWALVIAAMLVDPDAVVY